MSEPQKSEPQKSEPQKSEPQNGRGALFAGGLAAILASACCLGPLVLMALLQIVGGDKLIIPFC